MSSSQRPLALRFPLYGSRLIEASAGTGKTFTISALYLRLILRHGGDEAFREALLPPQILVVTFTDAATRELRDRIRARLVQAAAVFRGDAEPDELLAELRADFPESEWSSCALRLELAAQWMDEAAVSTIHGWCQRMLREHAFDSGSLFSQTLETDHSELLAEVVRDYWRQQCYPLDGSALSWVIQNWENPVGLGKMLKDLLGETGEPGDQALGQLLKRYLRAREEALATLKAPWLAWADEIESLLDEARESKAFNGTKLKQPDYKRWTGKLREWASGTEVALDISKGFERLTPSGLAEVWKTTPPDHAALNAMVTLSEELEGLPDPVEPALRHAAAWVRQRFDHEKRQRAEMGFDDMLSRLDTALQSDNGLRLAEVIRRQFPIALIDEFQDTDPLQYRIFDTLYQVEANRDDCGLFMIGDPKQAIYSFRGADIYTYLRARRATQGRHYNLERNFRSSQNMVDAVNELFLRAERSDVGSGAFLLREELPFIRVGAQGREEVWVVEGEEQSALTAWYLTQDEPVAKKTYFKAMAEGAASEIVRLLDLGQRGRAGFTHEGELKSLLPSDIAVLVRDFKEAQAIRGELAARGVRSVYLSDKDSVFAGQEARDVMLWLRACAEPDQDRSLRAALASATLGLGLDELEALNLNERSWERRVMQFRGYHQRWQRQGVLPMLRQLFQDFTLPQRLMTRADGERVLTNLLHLAELLQQASAELDGELALIRHLSELLANEGQTADDQVLRLESDEALVRVVTIHKSKGLEYPLVFLPFICAFRSVDGGKPFQVFDGERRRLVLNADDQALASAERERLGEDLRLLYVALTRAQHACWIGVADLRIGTAHKSRLHDSALGYLLGDGQSLAASKELTNWLDPLINPLRSTVAVVPEASQQSYAATQEDLPPVQWSTPDRSAAEHWWIASYSALRLDEGATAPASRHDDAAPDSLAMQNSTDDDSSDAVPAALLASAQGLHRFPRGSNPGTFLHGLLELAADEGFAHCLANPAQLREAVARRCQRRGLEAWIDPLCEWLSALLSQQLALGGGGSVSLADLTQYQSELEFWFEAQQVDVIQLDRMVRSTELSGAPRQPLQADTLNGMFKGFIDLAFEYQGRYYVVDYKSNWLGADDGAYTREAMEASMAAHRYDLQYVLYVLALHRQLRLRLPDYDYDRDMGGALYLFMRAPGNGVYQVRPAKALIEQLDTLFLGQSQESFA
ncbi:TPA: exodeoxyribonuclease V subunit beta [Pseudomonas aeruginosa]|uniref:exodeoxyribonuclease V subunit beta n=1 Tax=Pseudomonas aeruginosa TaxID=287 RepID=UPI00053DC240|nr:exodeoxyribonuclease V subunit beta [Pseudomonas aeruginosa]MBI7363649.1 exodeoxyribonuclease V subunit beta [Pseudomonas aeruginosa]MBX6863086.1 exodeoxyribonuclease V subunit beta [Pseudomonas aeruginosa]MCZ9751536.1 exodeoxyribonuclease V subunit beta [Pseudomonas aeruginosa]NPS70492.1 exodeoxyribonuclease V subunit beta [Pseudomonas aeruginosa]PQM13764.1 exodeoxyribonuclease V subunit beta [Pseudomonas aeruginosa]